MRTDQVQCGVAIPGGVEALWSNATPASTPLKLQMLDFDDFAIVDQHSASKCLLDRLERRGPPTHVQWRRYRPLGSHHGADMARH